MAYIRLTVLVLSIILLAACEETEFETIELEFLELRKDGAYFANHNEKEYLKWGLSDYEYNNFSMKTGEILIVEREKASLFEDASIVGDGFRYYYEDEKISMGKASYRIEGDTK